MKPVYLELQAFGPFVNKETVDFEKVTGNGIFLVKGPTGSGKTTIFDAMTFALYGGASGENASSKGGRNSLEKWRCEQASADAECYVKFVFISDGKKYSFVRRSIRKIKNLSEEVNAFLIDDDGNEIPLLENPTMTKVNAKAVELTGLNKDQFRQVVLLPQGQFEKFLTAKADDKENILSKIFDTVKWQEYADNFFNAASERKKKLDKIKAKIEVSLEEEEVQSMEGLKEKTDSLILLDKDICNNHDLFDGKKKSDELERDKKLNAEFIEFDKLLQTDRNLTDRKVEIDGKRNAVKDAQRAENVRKYLDDAKRQSEESSKRTEAFDQIISLEEKYVQNEKNAETEYRKYEENSEVDELNALLVLLESKTEYYDNLTALQDNYSNKYAIVKSFEAELSAASEKEKASSDKAEKLLNKYNDAVDRARIIRKCYYDGIYGQIADELSDNQPCPVCGSTEHPNKASKLPDSVSEGDMKKAEASEKKAKDDWEKANAEFNDAKNNKAERERAYFLAKTDFDKAESELSAAKSALYEGIDDKTALIKKIDSVRKGIDSCHKKSEELLEKKNNAVKQLSEYKANREAAAEEKKLAEENYQKALKLLDEKLADENISGAGEAENMLMDKGRLSKLQQEITEYETTCAIIKKNISEKSGELEGKIRPDEGMFKSRQDEIDRENDEFNNMHARIQQQIERLDAKYNSLLPDQKKWDENIQSAESDLSFAKRLKGESGIGLQRYVLGIMFNQVVNEANNMLLKVHGGRYQLFRSDAEGRGRKKGLDLIAHDNRVSGNDGAGSGQISGRNVSMLSGGEKFLVSLALSIGLSAVARQSGIKTEALFIDEGFGTLDEESINDAMDVLECVKSSNGIIGIISHVKVLEENITKQIEVVKSERGSSLRIC